MENKTIEMFGKLLDMWGSQNRLNQLFSDHLSRLDLQAFLLSLGGILLALMVYYNFRKIVKVERLLKEVKQDV